MTTHALAGSYWKEITAPTVKVGAVDKALKSIHAYDGSAWKETYSAGPDWANMAIGTRIEWGMFAGITGNKAIIMKILPSPTSYYPVWQWAHGMTVVLGMTSNGYSDWVLPNQAELTTIVNNKTTLNALGVGGHLTTITTYFWTNEEGSNPLYALAIRFNTPYLSTRLKTSRYSVIAVRLVTI